MIREKLTRPTLIVPLFFIVGFTAGCQFDTQDNKAKEELSAKTTIENCLNLRTGTVNVKLIHPNFLKQSWYLDPITSEKSNNRIALWKTIESEIAGEQPKRGNVLIVDDSYYESVETIVNLSKVEPGPLGR
jgi:hypothetical protein